MDSTADYMKIDISIHCRGLKKMDVMSNTDAFAVFYLTEPQSQFANSPSPQNMVRQFHPGMPATGKSAHAVELGRTEVIYDSQNPDFVKNFEVCAVRVSRERREQSVFVCQSFFPLLPTHSSPPPPTHTPTTSRSCTTSRSLRS